MEHPELKHDWSSFSVCRHPNHTEDEKDQEHECEWYQRCQHEAHTVIERETLQANLVEMDGDFNIEISVPSSTYEAAVAAGKEI